MIVDFHFILWPVYQGGLKKMIAFSFCFLHPYSYLSLMSLIMIRANSLSGPSFLFLSQMVREKWKAIDKETKDYCELVCRIIKDRHSQLLTKYGNQFSDFTLTTEVVPTQVNKGKNEKSSSNAPVIHTKAKERQYEKSSSNAQKNVQPRMSENRNHASQAMLQDAEILHNASQVMMQDAQIDSSNNNPEYVYLPVQRYLSLRASWTREQAMLTNPVYCRLYTMMQQQYQQNQGAFLPPTYEVDIPNSNKVSVSSGSLGHSDHSNCSDHSDTR